MVSPFTQFQVIDVICTTFFSVLKVIVIVPELFS